MVARKIRRTTVSTFEFPHVELAVLNSDFAIFRGAPSEGSTSIHIGGLSSSSIFKAPRKTFLEVYTGLEIKALGYASGNSPRWEVICNLPRDQFADLLAIVIAGRLRVVEMDFDQLKWNKGTLRGIQFTTRPLSPSD